MNGIPFAYWGAGNCTDFMPATASLEVYYNVNQPDCYTVGSNILYNIAPNFTQYTASTSAQYDFNESALDCRSNSITAYYPFSFGGGIGKTIMFRAKLDNASEQYFLFRNTLNLDEGARAFSANNFNGGGLGFQRGVNDCRNVLPTSSVAGFNNQFVTIAIQTDGNGFGIYYINDNGYSVPYGVSGQCTVINDYDVIMENAGFVQSWAVWNKQLSTNEMKSASIALGCNALYDPYINPQADALITNGLVSYLGCDSFSGTTWTDKSGKGNNATMYGASTNQVSGGVYFNGFTYDANKMNYLQFANPLANTPTNNATLIMQGVFDTEFTQFLFRKGWQQFGYLSGSFGWDTVWDNANDLFDFRASEALADNYFNLDYTPNTSKIYVLTLNSGSTNNIVFTKPKTYLLPDVDSAPFGASGVTTFTGSGYSATVPLTFGNSDLVGQNCNLVRFDSTTGNSREYTYINQNGVQAYASSGGGADVFVNVYPNTTPYKYADNQGNTLGSLISFLGESTVTASVTQSLLQANVMNGLSQFPFKGQISNLLVYNRALTPVEIFSNYNYLVNNTVCSSGSIPSSQLPVTFPVSDLVIWNNCKSVSGSIWYDISGNNNNGTIYGTALTLSGSLGWSFNGTDNYVVYSKDINALPSSSWTMQTYTTLFNDNTNRVLFNKGWNANGWITTFMNSGSNAANKGINFTSFNTSKGVGNYLYPTGSKVLLTISANTSTNIIKFYANENLIGSSSGVTDVSGFNEGAGASANSFVFGYNPVSYLSAGLFKGAVSDILIYSKELTLNEVSQSYAFLQTQGC